MGGQVTLLPEGEQQSLDRYQLIGEIASGGMATVYLARLPGVAGFQRLVAIKRLHPHLANEREFVEMFLDEARLAASIHHRNVVPIVEIGTSSGGYYLVMEYIEGVTLARLMTQAAMKQQPVPRRVLLRLVLDTLSGLHAAHELADAEGEPLGVVHRDCSPQNILIGLDGCTRITDFGIARASSRLHTTREGAMKGKLAYMAPEQTQGDTFDRRADLFSVSVVLWEVLSGRRLFRGKSEAETLRRLLHDPIAALGDVVPSVHPALDALCAKGLERDPDKRFQTAAEMGDALEQAAREADGAEAIAGERHVEVLMKERYGADVASQREALRTWMQATPTAFVDDPRTTVRGLGVGTSLEPGSKAKGVKNGPATKRGWPQQDAAAADGERASEDDETHIYDPTSTTGVTAERSDDDRPSPQPSTTRSPHIDAGAVRRRRLVIAAALIAAAVLVVLVVRNTGGGDGAPADVASATASIARAARPVGVGTPKHQAAPSATVASATADDSAAASMASAAAGASGSVARRSGTKRHGSSGPRRGGTPAASAKPAGASPSSKPPNDLDDLSNPYR